MNYKSSKEHEVANFAYNSVSYMLMAHSVVNEYIHFEKGNSYWRDGADHKLEPCADALTLSIAHALSFLRSLNDFVWSSPKIADFHEANRIEKLPTLDHSSDLISLWSATLTSLEKTQALYRLADKALDFDKQSNWENLNLPRPDSCLSNAKRRWKTIKWLLARDDCAFVKHGIHDHPLYKVFINTKL
jgi:hypothetical protein